MAYLEVSSVFKRFGAVQALDDISFSAEQGEVIAILGENGAGKTTLANILFGLYRADSGDIRLQGKAINPSQPAEALAAGIGMIHQHFNLVANMSAYENIILGVPKAVVGSSPRDRISQLASKYGFTVDLDAETGSMPVGMQQRVEILKVLFRDVSILILDEPTSVLAPAEVSEFLDGIKALRDSGKTIFFVTHKLDEVMEATDRVLVMQSGRLVAEHKTADTSPAELSREMIGGEIKVSKVVRTTRPGDPVLELVDISATDERGALALKKLSLNVRAGEILGIAGVDGNGQRELSEVIAGLRPSLLGKTLLGGEPIDKWSPKERYQRGVGFVPEDRQATGLVLDLTVAENLFLRSIDEAPATRNGRLDRKAIAKGGSEMVARFDIRPANAALKASALSGGNQQKIILAREISAAKRLLVVVQPTKGLDVGAIAFVQSEIVKAAENGVAVLYISTELEHILEIADRIAVISGGRITGTLSPDDVTAERISLLMAGLSEAAA